MNNEEIAKMPIYCGIDSNGDHQHVAALKIIGMNNEIIQEEEYCKLSFHEEGFTPYWSGPQYINLYDVRVGNYLIIHEEGYLGYGVADDFEKNFKRLEFRLSGGGSTPDIAKGEEKYDLRRQGDTFTYNHESGIVTIEVPKDYYLCRAWNDGFAKNLVANIKILQESKGMGKLVQD